MGEEKPFIFSLSLFRLLLCHFVLLSYPTQLKFPADVCVLPPPPLSLFLFLHTQQKVYFFFFPPTIRLELLPSPVLPHPARLNREKRTRTHGQSVFEKGKIKINKQSVLFIFLFLVKRFCFFFLSRAANIHRPNKSQNWKKPD